jgi:hypothetical protein
MGILRHLENLSVFPAAFAGGSDFEWWFVNHQVPCSRNDLGA